MAVNLAAGQHVSNIDIGAARGASAAGRVYDPDTQANGTGLAVWLVQPNGLSSSEGFVDATGHYTTGLVSPGSYYLKVLLNDGTMIYYPNYRCTTNCDPSQAQLLDFSVAQGYSYDFAITHLDRVFQGAFEP